MLHTVFEVSWEVCNKVGGIHTVVSTKAKTVTARYGDEYVAIGPWLMSREKDVPFETGLGFGDFEEACRSIGIPVRVGRWLIPGQPRTILVDFSGLFAKKDHILAGLWERHRVDSLPGGWDYEEPVLFGWACGMVIEKWWGENVSPFQGRAVAHFHEWMTASGMLYLKDRVPDIGTVFTTHATMLGRSVSANGQAPQDGLMGREPDDVAASLGVASKHSLEGIAARAADVFTTVSEITADEALAIHRRRADPILPNGIDLEVMDEMAGDVGREAARAKLVALASTFTGEDVSGAALLATAGRYEFHNKGLDVFLDALAAMNEREGKPIVAFILVPAGNSGLKDEYRERAAEPREALGGAAGISTHDLLDEDRDPVHGHCRKIGLTNEPGARVKVIQVPVYLHENDGLLNLPYAAVLRAMDLSCFPSFYEPWGYTPEESLAVGVPTVTSDHAGFGHWLRAQGVGPDNGVYVLSRNGVDYEGVVLGLENILETFLGSGHEASRLRAVCRRTAHRAAWSGLIAHYGDAYDRALRVAGRRMQDKTSPRRRRRDDERRARSGPKLSALQVSATLPVELQGLQRLADNYWWSWDHEAARLFQELSPVRWEACEHNPIRLLDEVSAEDLAARAEDPLYVDRLRGLLDRFDRYRAAPTGGAAGAPNAPLSWRRPVAYFSAEYAIHESCRIYSGGLGILAGDHLKSASDLDVPMVAIGLFYRSGYMKQRLTAGGEQIAELDPNHPADLPLRPVTREGEPLEIELQLPSGKLTLRAFKLMVGRVPLFLLDSDVASNRLEDRGITTRLYPGDQENRLRQEIVLGRGGVRLLEALEIEPSVYHCNEGHAAFLALERVRRLIREHALTFEEARVVCRATTVFTTHTPVPAGHDRFSEDLMRRYFSDAPDWLGVPWECFFRLGGTDGESGSFNMTYLAMGFANFVNGVSKVHGEVSQGLLHPFWSRVLECEVPVAHVTNGVHLPTWTSRDLSRLLRDGDRPLHAADFEGKALDLDPRDLWEVKQRTKKQLLRTVRASLDSSFSARSDRLAVRAKMLEGLDNRALLLGFARRFAPYKRAHLLFRDRDRLAALVNDRERPLRILLGGKAHPEDDHGKNVLREVASVARTEPFVGRVFFLENYDLDMARTLVQGIDVWLNTPTRPLEASGTSGMKVAANGGLNLSIEDGWWVEAADGVNGWSIGGARTYADQDLQDELDATTLYELLEKEIVPLFFARRDGVPHGWLDRVKRSLQTIPPVFNTDRMVAEYRDRAYEPLAGSHVALAGERYELARSLAEKHARVRRGFGELQILDSTVSDHTDLKVGDRMEVAVRVDLGSLTVDDVAVELVLGHRLEGGDLEGIVVVPLSVAASKGTEYELRGSYRVERCGSFSYGVRIRAREDGPLDLPLRDLVTWT